MPRSRLATLLFAAILLAGCGNPFAAPVPTPTPIPRPSFVEGWYSDEAAGTGRLAAYAAVGVNEMVLYQESGHAPDTWLQAAADHGILLLLQPDPAWVRDGDLAALRTWVQRYRSAPALGGWYLYDEPERAGLPPQRLAAAYAAIHRADPDHPVAVAFGEQCRFGTGALNPAYLAGFDLLLADYYPFYRNLRIDAIAGVKHFATTCVRTAEREGKEGPIIVLQAFGAGQHDGPFQWRDPIYTESLCLAAESRVAGVKGILFWDDRLADAAVWHLTERVLAALHDHTAMCSS